MTANTNASFSSRTLKITAVLTLLAALCFFFLGYFYAWVSQAGTERIPHYIEYAGIFFNLALVSIISTIGIFAYLLINKAKSRRSN